MSRWTGPKKPALCGYVPQGFYRISRPSERDERSLFGDAFCPQKKTCLLMPTPLLDPPVKPKSKRGGWRPGGGRPPLDEPLYIVRMKSQLARAIQGKRVTIFIVEQVPGGPPSVRKICPRPLAISRPDLARAVAAQEARAKKLQEDFANASR